MLQPGIIELIGTKSEFEVKAQSLWRETVIKRIDVLIHDFADQLLKENIRKDIAQLVQKIDVIEKQNKDKSD